MSAQRTILCMKWGSKYGPEYINRLYGMVQRHLRGEFRFVCLTDQSQGIRAEVDISSDRFPKKIRTASKDKIPFVLIAGGDDAEAGAVSFRFRDGSQDNGVPVAEAVQRIVDAVRNRTS